eukprot:TRINITY_DN26153_c0_g1_i1.p1 TRINITY_DN26153_c0_g1~~TRINITY_DN26153_c0_g1_i1.p1  ORF type:complete len:607 (+),score=75.38 TRINITY_DN26153_c0_g1_i1:41-1861(+)
MPHAIGIDLGTTFSCVGIWENDSVTIIANKLGHRTTPSWVSFHNGERLVGEAARAAAARNPKNTLYDSKRLIGCKFSNPQTQHDIKQFPFAVVPGENDNPYFQINFMNETHLISPEQLAAAVLTHMKMVAEDYLGCEVTQAVVTVPSYFNDSQRQSTKDAGAIAGLDIIRLINEPTAAAVAYGLNVNDDVRNIVVFDLGGGTLDVTVLTVDNGVFEVLATCGDTHLGGEDFDLNIINWCVNQFKAENGIDLSTNQRAMKRIREKAQEAKHALSSTMKVDIFIESIADDNDLDLLLSRDQFDELNKEEFARCIEPVHKALEFANLTKEDINDVLLIGGSTRIPYIEHMLEDMFEGKRCTKKINPDEAVAFGASIVAATASRDGDKPLEGKLRNVTLMDVTPLNLGVELHTGRMSVMIAANTTIPYQCSKIFHNNEDSQTEVEVLIYEGMNKKAIDNKLLGCFTLVGLPPKPRGELDIEVTFNINVNGILDVAAKVIGVEDVQGDICIQRNKGLLSDSSITEKAQQEDFFKSQVVAKKKMDQLEELLNNCKRMGIESRVDEQQQWFKDTREQVAPASYATVMEQLEEQIEAVQNSIQLHKQNPQSPTT